MAPEIHNDATPKRSLAALLLLGVVLPTCALSSFAENEHDTARNTPLAADVGRRLSADAKIAPSAKTETNHSLPRGSQQVGAVVDKTATKPGKSVRRDPKAWVLNQKCKIFGDEVVLVSPMFGIKISSPKNNGTMLIPAPYDKAYWYSSASKKSFECTPGAWVNPFTRTTSFLNGQSLEEIPLVDAKKSPVIHGLHCNEMKAAPGFAERQLARFKQNYFPSRNPKEVQYDLLKDLKFDSKVCHTMQRVYGLPFTEGIPVQFLFHDLDNDPQTYLETVDAKQTTLSEDQFMLPSGLKSVSHAEEVIVEDTEDFGSGAGLILLESEDRKPARKR